MSGNYWDKDQDFDPSEPLPEAMTGFELSAPDPDFVNVSGRADQPLWVERGEIAAIGVRGSEDTLVVLKGSGMQLVAKRIHPNEVVQLVAGGNDDKD